MWRRIFLLVLSGAILGARPAADPKQQVFDLFAKIASELSAGNPMVFLEAVDHDMPHFEDFQNDVTALVEQSELTNSIEVYSDEGDDNHRAEELDWFMEIVDRSASRPLERRRAVVKFRLERRGKKWKIVGIDPLHFFAPPK
jgi:hypothetical protein